MDGGILIFGIGVLSGLTIYSLTSLFSKRSLADLLSKAINKAYSLFEKLKIPTKISVAAGIFVLIFIFFWVFLEFMLIRVQVLFFPYNKDPWDPLYLEYAKLTGTQFTQFVLGIIVGFLVFSQLPFLKQAPTDDERSKDEDGEFARQKKNYQRINFIIAIITVFSIFMPYVDRWLSTATSLEIANVGKMTFDQNQGRDDRTSLFVLGSGASPAANLSPNQLVVWLDLLHDLSRGDMKNDWKGAIDRDESYRKIIQKYRIAGSGSQSDARATIASMLNFDLSEIERKKREAEQALIRELEADKTFLSEIDYTWQCLNEYSELFTDYRLFLLDIKPLVITFTKLVIASTNQSRALTSDLQDPRSSASMNENSSEAGVARELIGNINDLANQVKNHLSEIGRPSSACDRAGKQMQIGYVINAMQGNSLPYKTLALAYLLSAIGSLDTAALEINKWIIRNESNSDPWHHTRASIELSLIMRQFMSASTIDSNYKNFMRSNVDRFRKLLPTADLKSWSDTCGSRSNDEKILVFNYMTHVSEYIRTATTQDDMQIDVLRLAAENKGVDLACFSDINTVSSRQREWKSEFLTRYARALLASSYNDRLYNRSSADQKRKLRELARVDLVEALQTYKQVEELEEQKKKNLSGADNCRKLPTSPQRDLCRVSQKAAELFQPSDWQQVRSDAKAALLNIQGVDR